MRNKRNTFEENIKVSQKGCLDLFLIRRNCEREIDSIDEKTKN